MYVLRMRHKYAQHTFSVLPRNTPTQNVYAYFMVSRNYVTSLQSKVLWQGKNGHFFTKYNIVVHIIIYHYRTICIIYVLLWYKKNNRESKIINKIHEDYWPLIGTIPRCPSLHCISESPRHFGTVSLILVGKLVYKAAYLNPMRRGTCWLRYATAGMLGIKPLSILE